MITRREILARLARVALVCYLVREGKSDRERVGACWRALVGGPGLEPP